jgi:hypothetical protein
MKQVAGELSMDEPQALPEVGCLGTIEEALKLTSLASCASLNEQLQDQQAALDSAMIGEDRARLLSEIQTLRQERYRLFVARLPLLELREQIRLFSELNQLEASILRKLIQKGKALPKAYTERRLQVLWKEIFWLLQKLQEEFRVEALDAYDAYFGAYADTYFNPRPDNFVADLLKQRELLEKEVIPHAYVKWQAEGRALAQCVDHTLAEVQRDKPQGKPRNLSETLQLALYVKQLANMADLLVAQSKAQHALEALGVGLEIRQVAAEGGAVRRRSVDDGASKRVVAEGGFVATFSSSSSSRARAESTLGSRKP